MRVAVTYENGNVFQHFGHTQEFKVFDIEDSKILSSEVISSNGSGHGALAGLMADKGVDAVICGGIGSGAMSALEDNGIEVIAGVTGDVDEAVKAYIGGELESTGVNCDHHGEGHTCGSHDDEENSCGGCGSEEGGCGGRCGGCSGCHSMEPIMEGKNVGKTCVVNYRGTFNDGTQFDSSYDRGEPLEFVNGVGMMIYGFDEAVANMEVGEKVNIHLEPAKAYGEIDPKAVITMEISEVPGCEDLTVGQKVYLQSMYGHPFPVTVKAKDENNITFDANHEMAGKELNFEIELVEVR